jgi:hypothetical protein
MTASNAAVISMTASNAAVINRLVHLARTGSCAVAGVNASRGHNGSARTNRGLRT